MKAANLTAPPVRAHTLLVLEALSRLTIKVADYFAQVEDTGVLPSDWSLILLKAKELENKTDPRDVSIICFEVRMMASICERNIGDQLLSLFSLHSMTSSGSELRAKLEHLITLNSDQDHVWITFHLDLEQWNYTFRSDLMALFIAVLNQLFGVDHFSLAMRIFAQSTLVSSNSYSAPGLSSELTSWTYHAGGNQGIFQKRWTPS